MTNLTEIKAKKKGPERGQFVCRGRTVDFGGFTLTIRDGDYLGYEYEVRRLSDGVLEAFLVQVEGRLRSEN